METRNHMNLTFDAFKELLYGPACKVCGIHGVMAEFRGRGSVRTRYSFPENLCDSCFSWGIDEYDRAIRKIAYTGGEVKP